MSLTPPQTRVFLFIPAFFILFRSTQHYGKLQFLLSETLCSTLFILSLAIIPSTSLLCSISRSSTPNSTYLSQFCIVTIATKPEKCVFPLQNPNFYFGRDFSAYNESLRRSRNVQPSKPPSSSISRKHNTGDVPTNTQIWPQKF